jgi:hypothetical protein
LDVGEVEFDGVSFVGQGGADGVDPGCVQVGERHSPPERECLFEQGDPVPLVA